MSNFRSSCNQNSRRGEANSCNENNWNNSSKIGFETRQSATDNNFLLDNPCSILSTAQTSAQILENILDVATTIVQILKNCGIHEDKAKCALDVIIYSFLHFEEIREHPAKRCKKRIRKTQFMNDLINSCDMTKSDAKMTYGITKAAFKAFYEQQVVKKYDAKEIDSCHWNRAVEKTIGAFAKSGASTSETELVGNMIKCSYQGYLRRLRQKERDGLTHTEFKLGNEKNLNGNGKNSNGNDNIECRCNNSRGYQSDNTSNDMNFYCQQFLQKSRNYNLSGKLIGEYCCPERSLSGRSSSYHNKADPPPIIVKDIRGEVFMRIQGNKIFYDPEAMKNEAQRVIRSDYPESSSDCT